MKVTIENIKDIINEAGALSNADDMAPDVSLNEQGIDSLDLVNVYLLIEEKYNIKIPDTDLNQVQTIESIVNYINEILK